MSFRSFVRNLPSRWWYLWRSFSKVCESKTFSVVSIPPPFTYDSLHRPHKTPVVTKQKLHRVNVQRLTHGVPSFCRLPKNWQNVSSGTSFSCETILCANRWKNPSFRLGQSYEFFFLVLEVRFLILFLFNLLLFFIIWFFFFLFEVFVDRFYFHYVLTYGTKKRNSSFSIPFPPCNNEEGMWKHITSRERERVIERKVNNVFSFHNVFHLRTP